MGKIFIIMGKSATGKDTIFQRIAKDSTVSLKTIIPYTTRPIRSNEKNGREYFFVDEENYQKLKKENKIIEARAYETMHGVWRYFTVNDGQINLQKDNYIMITTLEAYLQIREYYGYERIVPIYIDVDNGERLERALHRERKQAEPKYTEMCRRFIADEKDFSKEKLEAAGITTSYMNDEIETCIKTIKAAIQFAISNE